MLYRNSAFRELYNNAVRKQLNGKNKKKYSLNASEPMTYKKIPVQIRIQRDGSGKQQEFDHIRYANNKPMSPVRVFVEMTTK